MLCMLAMCVFTHENDKKYLEKDIGLFTAYISLGIMIEFIHYRWMKEQA